MRVILRSRPISSFKNPEYGNERPKAASDLIRVSSMTGIPEPVLQPAPVSPEGSRSEPTSPDLPKVHVEAARAGSEARESTRIGGGYSSTYGRCRRGPSLSGYDRTEMGSKGPKKSEGFVNPPSHNPDPPAVSEGARISPRTRTIKAIVEFRLRETRRTAIRPWSP